MRDILFRGKRDGRWLEGSLVRFPDGTSEICYDNGAPDEMGKCTVGPDTVGQFTGLIDKSGKQIFEGDIVRYTNKDGTPSFYEVLWSKKHGAWMLRYRDSGNECFSVAGFHLMVEVVGNIYDGVPSQ